MRNQEPPSPSGIFMQGVLFARPASSGDAAQLRSPGAWLERTLRRRAGVPGDGSVNPRSSKVPVAQQNSGAGFPDAGVAGSKPAGAIGGSTTAASDAWR